MAPLPGSGTLGWEPGVGLRPSLIRGNLCNETSFLVPAACGRGPVLSHLPVPTSLGWHPLDPWLSASVQLPQLPQLDARAGGFAVQL